MIVAVYVEGITLWPPVHPVSRIEKLTPQGQGSQDSKQDENSFAAMFAKMVKPAEKDISNGFELHA